MTDKAISGRKRFNVALSFPGEHRAFVELIAHALNQQLGKEQIFYDEWYMAELARLNLDIYLQSIYRDQAELIVVFLCAEYEKKEWCGLEWRAIRDLIKQKQDETIMLVSVDGTSITGIFGIDGYLDAADRNPTKIANFILERLNLNRRSNAESVVLSSVYPVIESQLSLDQKQEATGKEESVKMIFSSDIEEIGAGSEIKYGQLENCLMMNNWKGADQETRNIVFKACNRFHGETLDAEDIKKLSNAIFCAIDQLWLDYSKGHFGFRVQQPIWYELESFAGVTYKIFQRFSQSVGWYEGDSWVKYENLNFSLDAPVGHLPYCRSWIVPSRSSAIAQRFHALMMKLTNSEESS